MKPKVFLLEDDPTVSALVQDVIGSHGWEIETAEQCAGTLAHMRQFKPDIVLLDVALPDGDGFEVCAQIRKDSALAKVPVLFLTAKKDVKSRLKGFAAGGQDYISKPFDMRELNARICAHLDIKREKDSLLRANDELLIRERLREEMLDMTMHDLRAPLTTIKITLEWVRVSGLVTAGEYEYLLKNAEAVTDWALFMISDILDIHAGRLKVEPAEVNLRHLVERLQSIFHPQLKGRNIALVLALPKDEPRIKTDNVLLMRIVANMLSNASKFSPSGSTITLHATHDSKALRVEVIDEGPGIPDDEKEKVFQKHYRTKSAQQLGASGTGLGLALCRLAADALGGRVWVEDAPRGGSRFIVELPSFQANGRKS